MKYKAVGFDYGGVIGGVGSIGVNFTRQISELLKVDEDKYKEVYFSLNHKINTGEVATWKEFWKIFLDKFGKPEKLDEVVALSDETTRHWLQMDSNMLALIDTIRQTGFKTGLLSSATVDQGNIMRSKGLDKHFDVFHISAETKLMKPDPKAFVYFTDALGIKPRELIFIDDSEKSLSTAQECGFTPILFTGYESLTAKLKRSGIL